jgi:hypothetical protein
MDGELLESKVMKWMSLGIASREVCIMMWFGGSEKEKVKERSWLMRRHGQCQSEGGCTQSVTSSASQSVREGHRVNQHLPPVGRSVHRMGCIVSSGSWPYVYQHCTTVNLFWLLTFDPPFFFLGPFFSQPWLPYYPPTLLPYQPCFSLTYI